MVERLSQGPASVSELAQPLDMTLSAVVQHLAVLEASGLVRSREGGPRAHLPHRAHGAALGRALDQRAARELGAAPRSAGRRSSSRPTPPPSHGGRNDRSATPSTPPSPSSASIRAAPARVFAAWSNKEAKTAWAYCHRRVAGVGARVRFPRRRPRASSDGPAGGTRSMSSTRSSTTSFPTSASSTPTTCISTNAASRFR